MTEVTFQSTDQ